MKTKDLVTIGSIAVIGGLIFYYFFEKSAKKVVGAGIEPLTTEGEKKIRHVLHESKSNQG